MSTVEAPLIMQNPGDTRLPPGVAYLKTPKRVLVVGDSAVKVDPDSFDEIVMLPGSAATSQEEQQIIADTTT